jgi:hypothetical protein
MGSASSASLRSIKINMIDYTTISSLQTPTNTNPREMTVKTKTYRGVWESVRIYTCEYKRNQHNVLVTNWGYTKN